MKRFEYHLDGLLRVKRQLEHLAELEQQKAQQAVADARARADELKQRLTAAADSLVARVGQAVDASRWVTAYELTERLGRQIVAAETDVQSAEKKLTDARNERVQVATEVEALRTLRQQQWDKWRQEVEQAGQEQLDEVVLRR
ncbi:MAG: flagellar FliJ family protein, partial [Gemmataceae bacterium]